MTSQLFEDLADHRAPRGVLGEARLREPQRDQIELRATDIDSLIGSEHRARLIWDYVSRLDLSELTNAIKSREGNPGHPAITPHLSMALWLYATAHGVGSARALARLCESDDAYRWLCGGVSVNYHSLADFRVAHMDLLDRLLAENVAALAQAKIVDLSMLSQDGVRVRASAGAASFRRAATLEEHLATATELVEQLKREIDDNPAASNQRIRAARERAARERAARERVERIKAAQRACAEIAQRREKREKKRRGEKTEPTAEAPDVAEQIAGPCSEQEQETGGSEGDEKEKKKPPRASTTDAEARVMKMADGGFRPAYNVQVVSVAGEQIVVAVEPYTTGSDRGLLRPMLEEMSAGADALPKRHLADGGFGSAKDIEWAHAQGVTVYCPPTRSKHGTDPFAPRRGDGPGVLAWRKRMASQEGKTQYRTRAICECIHARWRNWNLIRLTVRGIKKVRTATLWYALANNILQGHRMIVARAALA
jgi:transposase